MEKVSISVIVPVYNAEKYLERCIKSILLQSFNDYELILVDDGSVDSSGQLCDVYQKKYNTIQVIHQKNAGPQAACISGISFAQGNYICFIDSDDTIGRKYLEVLYRTAVKEKADIVMSQSYDVNENNVSIRKTLIPPGNYDRHLIEEEIFPVMVNAGGFLSRGIQATRWGKLFKKDLVRNNIDYYSEQLYYGEDFIMVFSNMLDCTKFCIVNEKDVDCSYLYTNNPNSIVNSYKRRFHEQNKILHEALLECSKKKNVFDFKDQILADYISCIVYSYTNQMHSPSSWREVSLDLDVIASDVLFKRSVEQIDYSDYGKTRVFIIEILRHWNWFNRNIITRIVFLVNRWKNTIGNQIKELMNRCE